MDGLQHLAVHRGHPRWPRLTCSPKLDLTPKTILPPKDLFSQNLRLLEFQDFWMLLKIQTHQVLRNFGSSLKNNSRQRLFLQNNNSKPPKFSGIPKDLELIWMEPWPCRSCFKIPPWPIACDCLGWGCRLFVRWIFAVEIS